MATATYKKRVGTSGISGQLYETRLLSLILFRLLHDDSVEEFCLASNMDGIGAFDDICFRAKIKGLQRPILIFVQAKHKEDDDTFLNYDLIKNFHESFVKVKDIFYTTKSQDQDVLFKGKFEEIDWLFILYTNAKFYEDSNCAESNSEASRSTVSLKQTGKPYQSNFAEKLYTLIGTSEEKSQGSQADYTENDLVLANEKISEDEMKTLAEHFSKFLNDQSMNIMLDNYILLYHVILAQNVVHVSEVQTEEIKSVKKEKVKKAGQKNIPNPNEFSKAKSQQNRPEKASKKQSDCKKVESNTRNIPEEYKSRVHNPQLESKENKSDLFTEDKSKATKPDQEKKQKSEPINVEVRRYRNLKFRPDFFSTNDRNLMILRNKIYEIVIKNHITKKEAKTPSIDNSSTSIESELSIVEKQILTFLSEPSASTLSSLIGSQIIYKDDKLQFIVERPNSDFQKLEQINTSQTDLALTVNEAEMIAARNVLMSFELKVPATFGNIDLNIAGNSNKIEKRLDTLMEFIVKLCQKSKSVDMYNIVTIDKSVGEGFLTLTGGIGSALGNLLIYDKFTKLLKFTEDPVLLRDNARALFNRLQDNISIKSNFKTYRFDTKAIINFPKLAFDYTDEAKTILNKVVVYDKQSNHTKVEEILKEQIQQHQVPNEPHQISVKADKMVIYFHYEIQKWWMSTKSGKFLTKSNDIYKKVINNIFVEPQISALQTTFYMNNMNNFRYDFNKSALKSVEPVEVNSRNIIVSNIPILTTIKVIQCFRKTESNKYTILDLECILNLPINDFSALNLELKNTNKVLIFVCDHSKNNRTLHKRLDKLAETTADKKIIVITNNAFVEMAQEYFENVDAVLNDEGQNLIDLTPESRQDIVKTTTVIFQGEKVNLDQLINEESVGLIKEVVLNKLIRNETLTIGTSLTDTNYEKMQHLYIERKVHQVLNNDSNQFYDYVADMSKVSKPKGRLLRCFEDITERVVLITAAPGMGKSTLLTHLSTKTKILNKELWIVRINLLDHSKAFFDWQTHKTIIDIKETLKILCTVVTKKNNLHIGLNEINNQIYLQGSTGDEWADFELDMFLHFYNERELLFLFDGFDEICPHYKDNVIDYLKVLINYSKKHKIWVTSRPYSEILPDLQRALGKSYELDYINDTDQVIYLKKYWQENLLIEKLNNIQLGNVTSYIDFMTKMDSASISRIFHLFYDYLRWYFPHIIIKTNFARMIPIQLNPTLTDLNGGFVQRPVGIVMGTPLLLYLHANYFVQTICDDRNTINWKLTLKHSDLNVYEVFVETKLKILFEDKNEMNVHKPDINKKYVKDYADCIIIHKKLAANTLFFHRIHLEELKDLRPFKLESEYESVLNEIRCGVEKIGLISHVTTDNIPVFLYKTLEEYFATEFLCDIFKDENVEFACKNMLYTIAHITFGIFNWMNKKRAMDKNLDDILKDIEYKRPHTVSVYGHLFATGWPIEHLIRIRSSSADDYEADCFTEHNTDIVKVLRRLEPEERDMRTKQFQKNVIAKMKPHLRKYFILFPGIDSGLL